MSGRLCEQLMSNISVQISPPTCQEWLSGSWGTDIDIDDPSSFRLRILFRGETVGLVFVENILETGHSAEYRQLAFPIAEVCGLAVSNTRMYQDLHRAATTDPLTQINNRRQFFELAEREFSRSQRYGSPLSALMIDIDHYKNINDTRGLQAGDIVIVSVVRTFISHLRTSDICGRYGGEEFAVIMPETGIDTALIVAERIRAAVESQVIVFQDQEIRVTISIGAAEINTDTSSVHVLLSLSDQALYRAKESGRNKVCIREKEW
ncbi:MAG: GGDEF domain-containing protein [Spirochaetes bacterium]|nr:GGDEF domain-containing protein [Spirochaetota bacterium]